VDPIQHTVNSIAVDFDKIYLGMGNYHILMLNEEFSVENTYNISWEIKRVIISDAYIYTSSLKEKVTRITKFDGSMVEWDVPFGALGLYQTKDNDIVAGAYQGLVRVWEQSGRVKFDLVGHDTRIWAISEYGGYILTGDGFRGPNSHLRSWDKQTGELVNSYEFHNHRINAIQSNEGTVYLAMGSPGELLAFDIEKSKVKWSYLSGSNISDMIYDMISDEGFVIVDGSDLLRISDDGAETNRVSFEDGILSLARYRDTYLLGVRNKVIQVDSTFNTLRTIQIDRNLKVMN